jgi:RNA polymerase sigma factor (sigma-70 family)
MAFGEIEAASPHSGESTVDLGQTRLVQSALRHSDELLGFFRRQTRGGDEAQDLRQELFLRLSRVPSVGEIADLRAYCFSIARNLAIDFHRRRNTETQLFASALFTENAPSLEASPELEVSGRQDLGKLTLAVAELPPNLRQALLWARLDGLKLKEIGRRLGVSESMAGRYVSQAMARCQSRLSRTD